MAPDFERFGFLVFQDAHVVVSEAHGSVFVRGEVVTVEELYDKLVWEWHAVDCAEFFTVHGWFLLQGEV